MDQIRLEDLQNKSYCYLCGRPTSDVQRYLFIDSKSGYEADTYICEGCVEKSSILDKFLGHAESKED